MSAEKSCIETSLIAQNDVAAKLINAIFAEGIAEGIAEGEVRGEINMKKTTSKNLYRQGRDVERIAVLFDVAAVDVKIWLNEG